MVGRLSNSASRGGDAAVHPYDFRKTDRIGKEQLRAIGILHENFTRNLSATLSAYLRAYAAVKLAGVEQISFQEFAQSLPAPTAALALSLHPFEHRAVLEISPSLAFPILEMLLGGSGKSVANISREMTQIEWSVLESFLRVVLHDLREAWKPVAELEFELAGHESEALLLRAVAPGEAVIAINIDLRIGEVEGRMNLGIPSLVPKMLRHKFDQQWSSKQSRVSRENEFLMLDLIEPCTIALDARLLGPKISGSAAASLRPGDLIRLDVPAKVPLTLLANGLPKYVGAVVCQRRKLTFAVAAPILED